MKTRRVTWIGAGLAVAAAVSWWAVHDSPQRALAQQPSTVSESKEPVIEQVKALERITRNLQARLNRAEAFASKEASKEASAPSAPTPPEEPAVVDEGAAALARLKPVERNRLLVTSTLELMENVLAEEAPDRDWTTEATAALNERLSAPEFAGTRAAGVDCTEDVCRFLVQHDDMEARQRFQPALGTHPLRGNTFFHFDAAKSETVIYVAREGQRLPTADLSEAALRLAP
jgi:hypothetical protein